MMRKNVIKIMLILLMVAGIGFAAFNFLAVESDAYVIWQQLDEGIDPRLGTPFIRCWLTGDGCVVVYPVEP
jgi:hypothetical protein